MRRLGLLPAQLQSYSYSRAVTRANEIIHHREREGLLTYLSLVIGRKWVNITGTDAGVDPLSTPPVRGFRIQPRPEVKQTCPPKLVLTPTPLCVGCEQAVTDITTFALPNFDVEHTELSSN